MEGYEVIENPRSGMTEDMMITLAHAFVKYESDTPEAAVEKVLNLVALMGSTSALQQTELRDRLLAALNSPKD